MASKSQILDFYKNTYEFEDRLRFENAANALIKLSRVEYYLNFLADLSVAQIAQSTYEQQLEIKRKLYLTYLLLLEKNKENNYQQAIQNCAFFLDLMELEDSSDDRIRALEMQHGYEGRPICYLGLKAGQWFGDRVVDCIDGVTSPIVRWMTEVNEKRLYWVWGGGFLKTVLAAIPDTVLDTQAANKAVNFPNRFAGYLSWTLYYARFALNSILLLNSTFAPELSEEEKLLGSWAYWERFKTQWNIRKFALLNDSIWGIANMVCFFWFVSSDGDALTIALLVFDLFIAVWDYEEQRALFNEKKLSLEKQLTQLRTELHTAQEKGNLADVKKLENSIRSVKKEITKCKKEWEHLQMNLINSLVYALGLLLTFTLYTTPFFPVAAPVLFIINIVGVCLCFVLTVINNSLKAGFELKHSNYSSTEIKRDLNDKINDFNAMIIKNSDLDDQEKILLFLDIKQLKANSSYQEQMIIYQKMNLIRTVLIQSLIPALLFVSFVFLPLAVGIGVVASALGVALIAHFLIEGLFKAEKIEVCEFDNQEYEEFCADPQAWNNYSLGFFDSSTPSDDENQPFLDEEEKPSLL